MLKKIFSTVLITIFCSIAMQTIYAQGIGINETGAAPDSSAILDASSTDKGLLGPRMTTAQRDNISSPAIGLQIFNLDTDCVEVFFSNGGWLPIRCGCSSFPDATFSNPGGAANVPVNFDANTVVSTNTYNWIFDQGTPSSSADTSETVTWTTADTYEVTLTVSDENNCVSTHTENVVITPCASFPDATFTGSNGSINSPIAFSANGSGSGYTYDWTFPSGTPSSSTQQNPSVEWATDGTYTVELTVTDNLSCSATDTMEVIIDLCAPDGPWNFTNAGATGTMGPTQTQVNTAYSTTNLDGDVISNSGIQQWTVPSTGTYRISVAGAQGGNSNNNSGGLGSELQGDFTFTAGQEINILVGQEGETGVNGTTSSTGGGGGGTFVLESTNLLLAAGGGGGAIESARGNENGGDALVTLSGGSASIIGTYGLDAPGVGGGTRASGGADGYGGGGGVGAGGGGYFGNGGEAEAGAPNPLFGNGYLNNGNGGSGGGNVGGVIPDGNGGFGGGGGSSTGNGGYGGGGGGYSGGGGGGWTGVSGPDNAGNGGGGGSINNGTNQTNVAGANTGHGYVTIEKVCP